MTEAQKKIEIEDSLRLLSIFHYILGVMTALCAFFPIIYLVMGVFMIVTPVEFLQSNPEKTQFLGWLFVCLSSFLMLLGISIAVTQLLTARFISKRTNFHFCFFVSAFECLFIPFGTILGVFSILVLGKRATKNYFS